MHNKPTRNQIADEKFIDTAKAYVAAYNDWKVAAKKFGIFSDEADNAYRILVVAQKKYKERVISERKRATRKTHATKGEYRTNPV